MGARLQLIAVSSLPEVQAGDDLAALLLEAVRGQEDDLLCGDVVVVAQKVVSKSEGAVVDLGTVTPSPPAEAMAQTLAQDPRMVEVVLSQSRRVVRGERVLITETKHGFICANAGVDHSNVPGTGMVSLLPRDPDASADRLQRELQARSGAAVGVVISDTFGRPWRMGITNVAIGAAGIPVLHDYRDTLDDHGRLLTATVIAVADELAAAGGLLMGKSNRCPVVVIRGWKPMGASGRAADLIRPPEQDLFR